MSLPGATETGDSCAVRGPQGRRSLILICVWHHSVGPPRSHRNWRQFHSSQPSGTARPHSAWSAYDTTPLGLPGADESGGSFAVRSPQGTWSPLSGLRMTPSRCASQDAALKDGEASFWFAYDTIPLGPPGAHDSGDSFAVRSPQGRRGFFLARVGHHSAGPPGSPRTWRQFRNSQPPGTARLHSGLRMTPLFQGARK